MPTITVYADNDCYVEADAPTTVENSTVIDAGWSNIKGSTTLRALVHFDLAGLVPAGAIISAALYNLYGQNSLDSHQLDIERLTAAFSESTATWNTQPTAADLITTANPPGSEGAATWKSFDLLTAVRNWVSGLWANDGFRVKAHDESGSPGVLLQWDSDEGTNRPYLTITYNTPPTQPGAVTAPVAGSTVKHTTTIAWGTSTDVDSDAITYRVRLSQDGGATFPVTLVASTASLSASIDWTPYLGTLSAVLRVEAIDAGGSGVYSPPRDSGVFSILVGGSHMII